MEWRAQQISNQTFGKWFDPAASWSRLQYPSPMKSYPWTPSTNWDPGRQPSTWPSNWLPQYWCTCRTKSPTRPSHECTNYSTRTSPILSWSSSPSFSPGIFSYWPCRHSWTQFYLACTCRFQEGPHRMQSLHPSSTVTTRPKHRHRELTRHAGWRHSERTVRRKWEPHWHRDRTMDLYQTNKAEDQWVSVWAIDWS